MKIILGSQSPRRKEILYGLFGDISIIPPETDESLIPGEAPASYSLRISRRKTDSILGRAEAIAPSALIITCDTIVAIDGMVLGKPGSLDEALFYIERLNSRTHSVISALEITRVERGNIRDRMNDYEETLVKFKNLSRDEILSYINSIEYSDKAGGYAIQEYGHLIVEQIDGSISNVIGFPLRLFFRMMADMNLLNEFIINSPALKKY